MGDPVYTSFGQGCPGSNQLTPALNSVTLANTSQPFTQQMTNLLSSTPVVLFLGFNQVQNPASGCTLLVSTDLIFYGNSNAMGEYNTTLPVPNDITLLGGATIYFQGWGAVAGIPRGFCRSNGTAVATGGRFSF